MTGKLVVSTAGHDCGRCYVIVEENEGYVVLADGDLRPLEKPKRKNIKHIQVIKNIPESVKDILCGSAPTGNTEIKRAIKLYLTREVN